MNKIVLGATSTTQKSLSYKLTTYFRQKWLYQTIIGDVKRHVKKEISDNLQIEEQERINKILDSTMRRVRGVEQAKENTKNDVSKREEPKRKAKEIKLQNGNGDYTVKGAVKFLGIGESTLRKYMSEEKIKFFKIGTMCYFKKEELDNFKTTPSTQEEIEDKVEKAILKENTDEK